MQIGHSSLKRFVESVAIKGIDFSLYSSPYPLHETYTRAQVENMLDKLNDNLRERANETLKLASITADEEAHKPIPMILFCPCCNERHIDEGEWETKPHSTHACQNCGLIWKPAVVNTIGVRFLPGMKNG